MPEAIAKEIVQQWGRAETDSANTMALYQQVADHFFPRENSILTIRTPGEDKSLPILDPTGRLARQKMVAGLYSSIIPTGHHFFRLMAQEAELNDNWMVASYLNRLTTLVHNEMMRSNFITEFTEYLNSLVTFGTANMYSGWDKEELGLTYKDWDVANFRFHVDAKNRPNRCFIRWAYAADQAYEEFGEAAGPNVVAAAKDPNKCRDKFVFIWRIQKRADRDVTKADSSNYPWEETVINEKENAVVREAGYKRFPYSVTRWMLASQEVWGRGQGTIALSADKELQRQRQAMLLCADLANNPPRQTLASFEGTPRVAPGANNIVMEMDSIRALDGRLQGNFPITVETIKMQRDLINDIFYRFVFAPLEGLTGDRRTTAEIYERTKEGLVQLINPIGRLYDEGLSGIISNSTLLCIENHLIEPPPPELVGLKIDYLGRLALALQEQQADAFQRFAQFAMGMEEVVPGFTKKTISTQRAGRRMASTFGVNEGDLVTPEELAEIEQQEAQLQQQQQAAMMAQTAGQAYKDAAVAPGEGSPAEAMMGE